MGFVAFGYNLREEDYDLIRKMFQVVTDGPADVYDLQSYDPCATSQDIVFFFGSNRAINAAKENDYKLKIEFPDPIELDATLGDDDLRDIAWKKLKKLKEFLEEETDTQLERKAETQNPEINDLPAISTDKILQQLKVAMAQRGIQSFKCMTQDGREIVLTVEPQKCDADFCMTFAELFALKMAQEVLHVKEFELVPKPGSSWTTNPWRDR